MALFVLPHVNSLMRADLKISDGGVLLMTDVYLIYTNQFSFPRQKSSNKADLIETTVLKYWIPENKEMLTKNYASKFKRMIKYLTIDILREINPFSA